MFNPRSIAVCGLKEMNGEVVPENAAMLQLMRDLGFNAVPGRDDPAVRLVSKPL